MKCIICQKTEKDFITMNSAQNTQIDIIISKIDEKIIELNEKCANHAENSDQNSSVIISDYSEICEYINNENCNACSKKEAVDGEGYYWCKKYSKSFKELSIKGGIIEEIKKLKEEINILNLRKNSIKNIKFKDINIDSNVCDNEYEKYKKLLSKYSAEESANEILEYKICQYCESMIKSIVEDIVDDIVNIDEIVENVKASIEEDDDE